MCKRVFTTIVFVVFAMGLLANQRAIGNMIVKFHDDASRFSISSFIDEFARYEMSEIEVLSPRLNIYLFSFNHDVVNEDAILETVRNDSRVAIAQFNHWVDRLEYIPNDPLFGQQCI